MSNTQNEAKKDQNKNSFIFTLILGLVVVVIFFLILSNVNKKEEKSGAQEFANPTHHAETLTAVVEKAQNKITELEKKNEMLQKQFKEEMDTQITEQNRKQEALEEKFMNLLNERNEKASPQYQNMAIENTQNDNLEVDRSIKEIKFNLSKPVAKVTPKKNIDSYVPSGTFVKAVMIGGADASAAVYSQAILSPMVFRIIENGTMPNHKKSHLKNCVVTGAVFGDISSERGLIRAEQLSCIFPNGQILDIKINGAVFGPEGKNGIRGNPMWRENALLQRAFAAGSLSGLAEGLSQSYSTNSVSPEGVVQAVKDGKVFQNGLAKGLGKAMDKLADYNIQRAEQYHPVIQLSAGTVVDIVFLNGFYLDDEAKAGEAKKEESLFSEPRNANPWTLTDFRHLEKLKGEG